MGSVLNARFRPPNVGEERNILQCKHVVVCFLRWTKTQMYQTFLPRNGTNTDTKHVCDELRLANGVGVHCDTTWNQIPEAGFDFLNADLKKINKWDNCL